MGLWDEFTASTEKSEVYTDEWEAGQFETYGKDFETVMEVYKKTPARVWTLIDNDDGDLVIVNGLRYCNRVCYYITAEEGKGQWFDLYDY